MVLWEPNWEPMVIGASCREHVNESQVPSGPQDSSSTDRLDVARRALATVTP